MAFEENQPKRRFVKEAQKEALERLLGLTSDQLGDHEVDVIQKLVEDLSDDVQKMKRLGEFLDFRTKGNSTEVEMKTLRGVLQRMRDQKDNNPFAGGMARVEPAPVESRKSEPSNAPMPDNQEVNNEKNSSPAIPDSSTPPVVTVESSPEPDASPSKSKPHKRPISLQRVLPKTPVSPVKDAPEAAPAPPMSPVQVVERYIRCWNQKAFAPEYDCFVPGRLGISKETYVDRRMATWLAANHETPNITQEIGQILMSRITGNRAHVLCTRNLLEYSKKIAYLELYDLHNINGEWRINSVDAGVASDELMMKQMAKAAQ